MKKIIFGFVALAFIVSGNPAAAEVGGTISKTSYLYSSTYQTAVNKIVVTFLQLVEWNSPDGTLTFTSTNYSFNQGCNTIFGTYSVDGHTLSLSEPASTMMACETTLIDRDQAMSKSFSAVSTMMFTDGKLVLSGNDTNLKFTPKFVINAGK